jgi:hypothetical protein
MGFVQEIVKSVSIQSKQAVHSFTLPVNSGSDAVQFNYAYCLHKNSQEAARYSNVPLIKEMFLPNSNIENRLLRFFTRKTDSNL